MYPDGVRITQTMPGQIQNFVPGGKVLIIQMTGLTLDTIIVPNYKTTENKVRKSIGSTGRFELLQIDEVTTGADTIVYFTDNLLNSYENIEKIQLVSVVEGENIAVSGTLTSKAWNGNTGGIIALLGTDSILLTSNSIIDVSGKGFKGGLAPSEIYTNGLCRYGLSAAIKDTLYFRPNELFRSGNKGEGIITAQWPFTKGTGFNFNGGGAGNGLFSGGGGGSNYSGGGKGGMQSNLCNLSYSADGGWGGWPGWEFYISPQLPKAIFGGGGGSGTTKGGSTPSNGGDGGGMIILITGTVFTGSNVTLRANGSDAWPLQTTGSGAGGGGGGTILIDATEFQGSPIKVEIKGGNGSSTTSPEPFVNGAGGGGSGGVFWHSGSVSPSLVLENLGGSGGSPPKPSTYYNQVGITGTQGIKLNELILPLTGFLFNTVRGTDTICQSQLPNTLTASKPKGGNGSYTYVWQQSTDNINWSAAAGVDELRSFEPVPLTQTTYYRRIISSQNPVTLAAIHDTSRAIKVLVYPSIGNNIILGTDTICNNNNAKPLTGNMPSGGNNIYSYFWQSSSDLLLWNNSGTSAGFDPPALTTTTVYRRIVNSSPYCSDTSNHVLVTVLPSITGNFFSNTDTAICENTSHGRIIIPNPGGGDGSYTYSWQRKTTGGWNSISSTSDSVMYTQGILTLNTLFRRIVFSGNDNACIDTSNNYSVNIKPPVSNNFIEGSPVQYTCYNSPAIISGTEPQNGFGPGTYSYEWEKSSNNINWEETGLTNRNLESDNLISTTWFRRKVYSTPLHHECLNISSSVEVRINPLPSGNVFSTSDTVCAGSLMFVKFNVSGNGPFSVSVEGENETPKTLFNVIGPIDSIGFNPSITQEFIMVSVEDDSGCYADAATFMPVVAGEVFEVPVANAGSDDEVCGNVYNLSAIRSNSQFKGLWNSTDALFADYSLYNTKVTADFYGTHVFKWTERNWHCSDEDEVEVIFYEQPVAPEAGPGQDLDFSYTTELHASAPSVGSGKWTVVSGSCEFSDSTTADVIIKELDEETILKWSISNGVCPVVSDSLKITILPLKIKKAFTPNNDDRNDYFELGAVNAEHAEIKIFNRSGQLVYESENYCGSSLNGANCDIWSGLSKNNIELPEGTYFYIIKMKIAGREKEFEFKSFVEIIR